ncbi:MAG: 4-hydroxy-tetrahydrodipicolinate reductase [Tissierellales bacterium]|jgi:4-hydroxy-tetrahydrodipicolinate reductase|nr:4-hydroxy-tetrahydrodipicolinate reductase [Tissierellales bacterium]
MTKVIIYGIDGTMGKVLRKIVDETEGFELVAGIAPKAEGERGDKIYTSLNDTLVNADLLIDFSHPANLDEILNYSKEHSLPTLIATTGYNEDELRKIEDAGNDIPILWSTNLSLGVNLVELILSSFGHLLADGRDVELIEKHHNKKIDVPSGTALTLARAVQASLDVERPLKYGRSENGKRQDEIAIHAIRGGTIVGEHQVHFAGDNEVIEIRHTAQSKAIFARGALRTGEMLRTQKKGFFTMQSLLKTQM